MLLTGLQLARRLENAEALGCADYAAGLLELEPASGALAEPIPGGMMVHAGAGGPLSRATGLGLSGPVSPAELDRVEEFYRLRGGPCQVDVCPLADPSLVELLGSRGYRVTEFNNVLVRRLGGPLELPAISPLLEVRPAVPEELDLWAWTVSEGFASGDVPVEDLLGVARPFTRLGAGVAFLAFSEGEPAGGGILSLHGGIAGLYGTSTVPRFRNRGVQTALIAARLTRAAAERAEVAVCYTLPGSASQRNVERFGFTVAYTKVVMARDVPR